MRTFDDIKKHLGDLLKEEQSLATLSGEGGEILKFGWQYQVWYTKAVKLVELLGPDRLAEFVSHYMTDPKRKRLTADTYSIQDFIRGIGPRSGVSDNFPFDIHNMVAIRLLNQLQILAALESRIDSVFADVTGHLFAELQDSELRAASTLAKTNLRAAGALAGVVLERHLQRVADNHQILLTKKSPTIADLNDPLKVKEVYDVPTWRKIQLLADLRNLCVHQKKTEPTDAQVEELIAGVSAIVKSVF
jgi:hypothetical protein